MFSYILYGAWNSCPRPWGLPIFHEICTCNLGFIEVPWKSLWYVMTMYYVSYCVQLFTIQSKVEYSSVSLRWSVAQVFVLAVIYAHDVTKMLDRCHRDTRCHRDVRGEESWVFALEVCLGTMERKRKQKETGRTRYWSRGTHLFDKSVHLRCRDTFG